MRNQRISGLADPTDADDAVTRRYVASRFQAVSDEVQDKRSKLDALQNFLEVVNNQVLIREYKMIGWNFLTHNLIKRGTIVTSILFKILSHGPDIIHYELIDIFTLEEYFFIY